MKLGTLNTIYFIGIGGIGMSALARYFRIQGVSIYGYDRTRTPLTMQLEREGILIHYEENPDLIPQNTDLVIYTPAIPASGIELRFVRESGFRLMKRSEVLGALTKDLFTVAIAGTHGKTTITSMTSHFLAQAGLPFSAFIGGISNNFGSNLVSTPNNTIIVVEADEFDKSFLQLQPSIAVISSMDADHLDIYHDHNQLIETYQAFARNTSVDGNIIVRYGLKINTSQSVSTYGIDPWADVFADNIRVIDGRFVFDLHLRNAKMNDVSIPTPGRHNIENALAAASVAELMGVTIEQIVSGISTFTGVQRRFDFKVRKPDVVYIDDYAHHPEELRACISGVKELFPGKKITGIFQPHLFSRTRDFMDGFARSLSMLDQLILLDIYPAREEPIAGITSSALLQHINLEDKQLCSNEDLLAKVDDLRPEVLLTLGAGDIDQFIRPLQQMLSSW
ncbi:MAG: UDP-N-acetylmuramate--L-alanine ligase [Bacteroidales bacterium]|nr:UDP-N-acetylmuramate--L-alanine ligase [Bacteroidales bacterium]